MAAENKFSGILLFFIIFFIISTISIILTNYIKKLPQTVNVISVDKLLIEEKDYDLSINDADMVLFSMVTLLKNNQIKLDDDVRKHIVNETYLLVPRSYFKDKEKE